MSIVVSVWLVFYLASKVGGKKKGDDRLRLVLVYTSSDALIMTSFGFEGVVVFVVVPLLFLVVVMVVVVFAFMVMVMIVVVLIVFMLMGVVVSVQLVEMVVSRS